VIKANLDKVFLAPSLSVDPDELEEEEIDDEE
jgi:hypothetical protein